VIIRVGNGSRVELDEPDAFDSFKVVLATGADLASSLQASGAGSVAADSGEAMIDVTWLRRRAEELGRDAGWQEQLDGMIAFAKIRGWTDEHATAIQAHIETE
jgi:hypothetical protein